jgi:hypothetical protein
MGIIKAQLGYLLTGQSTLRFMKQGKSENLVYTYTPRSCSWCSYADEHHGEDQRCLESGAVFLLFSHVHMCSTSLDTCWYH